VDEFLQTMGNLFECVLFTASLGKVRICTEANILEIRTDKNQQVEDVCNLIIEHTVLLMYWCIQPNRFDLHLCNWSGLCTPVFQDVPLLSIS